MHRQTHTQTQTQRQTQDLVPLGEIERDSSCVLDSFTDERVAASKQQRLLDARRVVAYHIHHQLHVLGISYLSARTRNYCLNGYSIIKTSYRFRVNPVIDSLGNSNGLFAANIVIQCKQTTATSYDRFHQI